MPIDDILLLWRDSSIDEKRILNLRELTEKGTDFRPNVKCQSKHFRVDDGAMIYIVNL